MNWNESYDSQIFYLRKTIFNCEIDNKAYLGAVLLNILESSNEMICNDRKVDKKNKHRK